ncbi:MAG: hypothetical protein ACYCYI_14260 [Saccharofermentanales bacterium]
MLRISLFEFFTRALPEGFLFILANYAFSRKKIEALPYIGCSIILGIFIYLIRLIEINFGVHIILNLICLILLSVYICKLDSFTTVKGSMLMTLLSFIIELINYVVLMLFFDKAELVNMMNNQYQKVLTGIPGIFLFTIVSLTLYFYLTRKLRIVEENGQTSSEIGE